MKITTKREAIIAARKNFERQYADFPQGHRFGEKGPTVGEARKALKSLDTDSCSEADINAAIGAEGWAAHRCDECGEDRELLMHYGDTPDYDAQWQELCAECLAKGVAALTESPATSPPKPQSQP